MAFNYIDEVDSTLNIKNLRTNKEITLFGKVLNYTASNPMKNNIVKDNLSRQGSYFSYTENNREPSTLDFSYVNIGGKTLQDMKDFFKDRDDLEVIYISGKDSKSKLIFIPCILSMEPMAPSRNNNFEGQLSFVGAYIKEEIFE